MKCLGLDIGSTTIKGALLDLERDLIETPVTRPFPAPISGLPVGRFEVSPLAIEREVQEVVATLLDAAPEATSLYCSGQMGGVVLVDESGEPLTNYLSWRDQRTLGPSSTGISYLDEIRRRWPENVLVSLGNELQPGSATGLLFWLAQHESLPPLAMPASVADFVLGRLCGVRPKMHVTQAVGMLNHQTSDWHHEAFALLGLKDVRLPELSHKTEAVGQFTLNGRTLRALGSYGDQQCALRGAGLQRGELSLNVSTGSQVSRRVAKFEPGRYQTRRYFAGDWLNTITHLPAGRSLNVLVDLLTELAVAEGVTLKNVWENIIRKSAEVQTTNLQVDLAFFAGPLGTTGSIDYITTENLTVGQLFYAAFHTMAKNYALCAERLDGQRTWQSVVVSGGLTQAVPLLRRLIQKHFDVPLREAVGDETMAGLMDIARELED